MSHSTPVPFLSDYTATNSLWLSNKFFNHIAHGIVALHRLGADSQRIKRYIDPYADKLAPREENVAEENQEKDLLKLLGGKNSYKFLYDEYERRLQKNDGSLELLIAQNLSLLTPGLGASAFHGVIHLGYGYAAKSPEMTLEGIAFMHNSYMAPTVSNDSVRASASRPSRNILEVLDEVRCGAVAELIQSELAKREWLNVKINRFSYFMTLLMTRYGNELVNWANEVELPSEAMADTRSLCKWMVNSAITVYAASEQRNDFFLLHGVTSAWSLLQVVPLLDNQDKVRDVIRDFLAALLAAYLAQGTPNLHLDWLTGDLDEAGQSWDVLIIQTLAKDLDTHIFKLVQVCHDMDLENSDPEMTHFYLKAASVALDFPLFFNPNPKV